MADMVLTILEVSQKQAYIFGSNKLSDNVVNSAVIAKIMSPEYFEDTVPDFKKDRNLVYSGGGHVVLEFPSREEAISFTKSATRRIYREYPEIEVFAVTREYDENPPEQVIRRAEESGVRGETLKRLKETEEKKVRDNGIPGYNLLKLTEALESKKSVRLASFHQGTFGIEKIDSSTSRPKLAKNEEESRKKRRGMILKEEKDFSETFLSKGYHVVDKFGELGGVSGDNNFIAVVHIDGNAMGNRVNELRHEWGEFDWEDFKEIIRGFSEQVDDDFKLAYRDMADAVKEAMEAGKLKGLHLKEGAFPIRRVITAGDDICFVTEGSIGIESAVLFLKSLNKKRNEEGEEKYRTNDTDGKTYNACAGVAIVHQKYPFYKAYELAERLCSNAKKFASKISADGTGRDVSAIDWHIEYGEIGDSLEDVRNDYYTLDGNRLEMRPYIVSVDAKITPPADRLYRSFLHTINVIDRGTGDGTPYSRSSLKGLRSALKEGELAADYYLRFHKIESIAEDGRIFAEVDGQKRAILFDALEVRDVFRKLGD